MICVFDCESVPDVALLKKTYGYEGSDLEVCEQAFSKQEEATGSSFLPHCFHKIVTIAALIADDCGSMIKVGCIEQGKSEEEILKGFLKYFNAKQPRLVSFNGKGFDIPTILIRSMPYNLSATAYFEAYNPTFKKDKWENYRQRYSERFHLDLFDTLGHFGSATRGLKLDTIASLNGLPGKYDVSGDEVYKLYFNQEFHKIDTYCESDVLNTYWLFLKFEVLSGHIDLIHYRHCLETMIEKMPQDKEYYDVFKEAIENEIQKLGG